MPVTAYVRKCMFFEVIFYIICYACSYHIYVPVCSYVATHISVYMYNVCILTHVQAYTQIDQLRTQLEQNKRTESLLWEQISKAKQKVSDLHESYDKQYAGEDIETQLKIIQRKMLDVKNEFVSIEVTKLHWSDEVHPYVAND